MMSNRRPPKKSETLEVRVPHEVKDALMRKAHSEGRSASDIVRTCIADYLDGSSKEAPSMIISLWKPAVAAGAAGIALLWSALAPTPVSAGPDLKAAFDHYDQNHDNVISVSEFLGRNTDRMFIRGGDKPAGPADARQFTLPLRGDLPAPPPGAVPPPKEMLKSEFANQDRDGNGSVTLAEFEGYHREMLHQGFATIDTNGDGVLGPAEYTVATAAAPGGGGEARFEDLDKNHDGWISETEFSG
jgi:Ca2+-binding EF-hand superfamily protein